MISGVISNAKDSSRFIEVLYETYNGWSKSRVREEYLENRYGKRYDVCYYEFI
jgi:hypothetical protein